MLAPLPTTDLQRVDPRSVPLARLSAWLGAAVWAAVLTGVAAAAMAFLPVPDVAVVAPAATLLLGLVVKGQVRATLAYRHTWYRVDTWGMEIRRGILWRRVMVVPRSRIQHTDVAQGPLERRFGLATLSLYTAGSSYSLVQLDGLSLEDAEAIRDYLVRDLGADAV